MKTDRGPVFEAPCPMRFLVALCALTLVVYTRAQSIIGSGGSGGGDGSILAAPLGLLKDVVAPDVLLNRDRVDRPRDFEPRLIFGMGMSVQQANLAGSNSSAKASSFPWVGGMVELGAGVTYRDRLGMAVQGSWGLNGYMLVIDSLNNSIYHTSKRAEARLWWLVRCKRDCPSFRKIGVAAGFTFQQADVLTRDEKGYQLVTAAPERMRPYIAPELGLIGSEGKDRYELTLRYVIHLDGKKAWETNAGNGTSAATYNASDNYLGLIARYHFGFKRKVPRVPPPALVPYEERETDTLVTMSSRQHRITMRLWDNAEVDGDTISVFLNDVPVLSGHMLTKKHVRLTLDLRRGTNYLMVVAHNEGTVPPNTATCIVRRGKGKEQLLIKTSHKQNQVVVIEQR